MGDWLRDVFRDRPLWMNALMVFSAFMAFVYVPWDIFIKPVARDQEVWFGIMFSGWGAKWAAVPHALYMRQPFTVFVVVAPGCDSGARSTAPRWRSPLGFGASSISAG